MKKIISILLVMVMLFTGCVMFSSCSAVNENDLKNDPYTTLNTALQNTSIRFFAEDAKTNKVVQKVEEGKGKITLSFESAELEIPKSEVAIYSDSKAQQVIANFSTNIDGTALGADMYINKDMLALASSSILGTDDAFAVYFATFANDLKDSFLSQMLGLDAEDISEIVKNFNDAFEQADLTEEELKNDFKEICEALKMSVATEDGDIVSTYVINNETLRAVLSGDNYISDMITDADLDDLDEVTFNVTAKIYIAPKEGFVKEIKLDGSFSDEEERASISASLKFEADKIALHIDGSADGDAFSADIVLSKNVTADQTSYNLIITGGTNNVTAKILDATYTITKAGDITFTVDIIEDENNTIRAGFKGKYEVTDSKISFSVTELSLKEDTYKFNLTVSIEAVSEIPAFPSDAKDIAKMTQADWTALFENISKGPLGFIMGGGH